MSGWVFVRPPLLLLKDYYLGCTINFICIFSSISSISVAHGDDSSQMEAIMSLRRRYDGDINYSSSGARKPSYVLLQLEIQ